MPRKSKLGKLLIGPYHNEAFNATYGTVYRKYSYVSTKVDKLDTRVVERIPDSAPVWSHKKLMTIAATHMAWRRFVSDMDEKYKVCAPAGLDARAKPTCRNYLICPHCRYRSVRARCELVESYADEYTMVALPLLPSDCDIVPRAVDATELRGQLEHLRRVGSFEASFSLKTISSKYDEAAKVLRYQLMYWFVGFVPKEEFNPDDLPDVTTISRNQSSKWAIRRTSSSSDFIAKLMQYDYKILDTPFDFNTEQRIELANAISLDTGLRPRGMAGLPRKKKIKGDLYDHAICGGNSPGGRPTSEEPGVGQETADMR